MIPRRECRGLRWRVCLVSVILVGFLLLYLTASPVKNNSERTEGGSSLSGRGGFREELPAKNPLLLFLDGAQRMYRSPRVFPRLASLGQTTSQTSQTSRGQSFPTSQTGRWDAWTRIQGVTEPQRPCYFRKLISSCISQVWGSLWSDTRKAAAYVVMRSKRANPLRALSAETVGKSSDFAKGQRVQGHSGLPSEAGSHERQGAVLSCRKGQCGGQSLRGNKALPVVGAGRGEPDVGPTRNSRLQVGPTRSHKFDLSDFGAVGDGKTDNTRAIQNAMYAVSTVADKGGGQLYVPPGRFLTGCFNLTSSMTLYLARDAVLLANPVPALWPLLPPLPSYGRGRELPGPRYSSFIFGQNLTDVIITGENGTVDGGGAAWWQRAEEGSLSHSRGPLVELLWSSDIVVSNITLVDSPFWTLHPVYCRNVSISFLSIFSPQNAPNSGGIYPDSCFGVRIEDCTISTGGDCIDVKSGWDEYGQAVGLPSMDIAVRRCHLACSGCSGLSIGSEMSGGVQDVLFEDLLIHDSARGFTLKTTKGRGGYVRNVTMLRVNMIRVQLALHFQPDHGDHPDGRARAALPRIADVVFWNLNGSEIEVAGNLTGLESAPVTGVVVAHVNLGLSPGGSGFSCSNIRGCAADVRPPICEELRINGEHHPHGMASLDGIALGHHHHHHGRGLDLTPEGNLG